MFLCQFEPENYNLNIDVAFLELYVKLSYEGTNIFSFHTWIDSSNLRMKKASERRNNFPLTYFFQSALPEFSSWEGSLDPCLSVLCTHCYTTSIFIPFKHTVHLGGHSKDVRLKNGLCHSSMSLTSPFFPETYRDREALHASTPQIDVFFSLHLSLLLYYPAYLLEAF